MSAGAAAVPTIGQPLFIGRPVDGGPLDMVFDEIAIWKRALTPDEQSHLLTNPVP